MRDNVAAFYDDCASCYHLIFEDWHRSIEHQSTILDELISDLLGPGPKRILDCSCGIGTQALGLAARGHAVTAADVSTQAVARARTEAERLHVEIDFRICDMRELHSCVQSGFEVVISCDNSLPHLLKAEELAEAVASIHSRLDPAGVIIASMRDYDAILEERPTATPIGLKTIQGRRRLAFQVWNWAEDGRTYDFEQFVGEETDGRWVLRSRRSTYRAIKRNELSTVLKDSGFESVQWIMPNESGFFQPLVIGRCSSLGETGS